MPAYDNPQGEAKKGVKFETENVLATINDFSKRKGILAEKIDFEVISVATTVHKNETIGNLTEEVVVFEKRGIPDISEKIWLDPEIRITQKYEILLTPHDPAKLHLHTGVAANAHLTNIAAFIKKDPRIVPNPKLADFFIAELNKKKLRNGFFINIFDAQMRHDVDRLCKLVSQHGKLDKDAKISLFSGPEFIPSQDDHIEYVYQTRSKIPGGSKYIGVAAGEVLVEYHKPIMGTASRNAKGKYINVYEPSKPREVDFTVSNSIKMEEKDNMICFSALNNGFAVIEDKILDVRPELILKNLTVKTGSIDVGTNKNAKLEITSDENVDAVGDGVKLSAFDLSIKGSVGEDAVIEGDTIVITGQTHRSSKIIGREVEIKTLKGSVEADIAKIGILEGGEVDAKNVKIVSILGAKVNASECRIDILGSNSTITVSKQLMIDSISGSENKIIVTPAATNAESNEFIAAVTELKEVKQLLANNENELEKNMKSIEQDMPNAKSIKAKIDTEKNRELVAPLIVKLREFNALVEKTKAIKLLVAELDAKRKTLVDSIQSKQDSILQSKVIAMQDWRGHNVIKFRLIEPAIELAITVDEKHNYNEVFLQKLNDEYSIGFETR